MFKNWKNNKNMSLRDQLKRQKTVRGRRWTVRRNKDGK